MVVITKIIEWDMGHRIPNHEHKCSNPHGHRYRLEVSITGPVDANTASATEGMIRDFGDIKSVLCERVHDVLDHGFMISSADTLMTIFFKECGANFRVVIVDFVPTAENIVVWAYHQIKDEFKAPFRVTRCRLYETPNSWAEYVPE